MALPPMFAGDEVELVELLDRYPDLPVGTRGFVTKTAQNGIVTVHIRGWQIVAATGAFRVVEDDDPSRAAAAADEAPVAEAPGDPDEALRAAE